jgi:hypothetical protein
MNISRYLARTLVNANLMSTRDYAQRYWWPDKPLDDAENQILRDITRPISVTATYLAFARRHQLGPGLPLAAHLPPLMPAAR